MSRSSPSADRPHPTAVEPATRLDDGTQDDAPAPPGRPVRLSPTPPGFWATLLGVVVALLAPFFGILIGSGIGTGPSTAGLSPMAWGFALGSLVGALALVVAGLGAARLWRHQRDRGAEAER